MFSRRTFLKTTAAALALLAGGDISLFNSLAHAWAADTPAGRELWLICDTPKKPPGNLKAVLTPSNPGSVNALDLASGQIIKIDVPFFGHAITQNPARPHQVATFEKWGLRGALVDLNERSVIASAEADEKFMFFGHAAFINGGLEIVTSEDGIKYRQGRLAFRDAQTLKQLQVMPSYGANPHECRTLDNGKTIIVMNQGKSSGDGARHPNIAWIEAASGKLLHQVEVKLEVGALLSHLDVSEDGWLCAVGLHPSADMHGNCRIAFISPTGKVLYPKIPKEFETKKMGGEVLSVTFLGNNSGLVAATLPQANMVVVLNYRTQEFVTSVDMTEPRGILPDLTTPARPGMIVSRAQNKDLVKIALTPPAENPVMTEQNASFGGNGSHMARIYV